MRKPLQIFSATFLLVFAILQVQPLYIDYSEMLQKNCAAPKKPECTIVSTASCSKTARPVCSPSKCMLPNGTEENEDCNSNGCNPFLVCNVGFCCYLVEGFYDYDYSLVKTKVSLIPVDDNRISSALSECFHPPELIS